MIFKNKKMWLSVFNKLLAFKIRRIINVQPLYWPDLLLKVARNNFHYLFHNGTFIFATDGTAKKFLPPYAAA